MKTFLVPTDFSATSVSAFRYARKLAAHLNAEVKLISVFHQPMNTGVDTFIPDYDFKQAQQNCTERLQAFIDLENQHERFSKPIIYEAVLGYASNAIVENAKEAGIEMIIMGASGEHDIADEWLGSVSSNVAQTATHPVLMIPHGEVFKPIRKILYACDFDDIFDFVTEGELAHLAKALGASIHVVFVKNKDKNYEKDAQLTHEIFRFDAPYVPYTSEIITNNNIIEAITASAEAHECDILAVSTHRRGFWQSLFHKSVTKALALHPKHPVMVLHHEDEKRDVRPEAAALLAP